MPATNSERTRIASQRVEGPRIEIACYGPDVDVATGKQPITATLTYDTTELPPATREQLSAIGFGRVAEGRWNRKNAGEVQHIVATLWDEMRTGSWQPGRVYDEREPDDLCLALAEVMKKPVHLIAREIEERMKYVDADGRFVVATPDPAQHTLYKDARGRTHRYFDKSLRDQLAAQPPVANVLARLTRERAAAMAAQAKLKPADGGLSLDTLFGPASPAEAAQ